MLLRSVTGNPTTVITMRQLVARVAIYESMNDYTLPNETCSVVSPLDKYNAAPPVTNCVAHHSITMY